MLNLKTPACGAPRISWPVMPKHDDRPFFKDTEVDEAEVLHASVEDEILQEACDLSWLALTRYSTEAEIARFLKQHFDKTHGASWQCVVGKTFGSYVSVDSKNFIHIHIGKTAVLLYKTFDEHEYKQISECLEDRCV